MSLPYYIHFQPFCKPSINILFNSSRTLTRQNLVDYVNSHYKAPRMVLAAAGGVNHEELVSLAKSHFSGVSFEYEGDAVPLLSPCRFTGSEVRHEKYFVDFNAYSFFNALSTQHKLEKYTECDFNAAIMYLFQAN